MKRLAVILAVVALQTALFAQTASDKEYKLLPGLAKEVMDTSADPFVNFFQYACGNFSKLYPIPADRSSFEAFTMMQDHTEHVLRAMLEKAASGGADRTPNEQKTGDFYAAGLCRAGMSGSVA